MSEFENLKSTLDEVGHKLKVKEDELNLISENLQQTHSEHDDTIRELQESLKAREKTEFELRHSSRLLDNERSRNEEFQKAQGKYCGIIYFRQVEMFVNFVKKRIGELIKVA